MGWECHWVWRNVCFSYRHFTCPVTPCPPRARLIFGKAATRTGPLCGGFAVGRCCPVLVAALPLWVHSWLRFFRVPARGRSTVGRHFHARLDAQVFGDALDDDAQVARGRVALAIEHPVQGLFAQARLARQLLERDLSMDQIAQAWKV